MTTYIFIHKVRKFHQLTANRFSTARQYQINNSVLFSFKSNSFFCRQVETIVNRDDLFLGFKCLIEFVGYTGDYLEGIIGGYFEYAFGRLNVIGLAIRHDINLKQLQFKKERLQATIDALNQGRSQVIGSTFNPAIQKAIVLFKSNMLQVFRDIEEEVFQKLYLKAQAFR